MAFGRVPADPAASRRSIQPSFEFGSKMHCPVNGVDPAALEQYGKRIKSGVKPGCRRISLHYGRSVQN
jgi:hypothetical protein